MAIPEKTQEKTMTQEERQNTAIDIIISEQKIFRESLIRIVNNAYQTQKRTCAKKETVNKMAFPMFELIQKDRPPLCIFCHKPMKKYTPQKGRFKGQVQKHSWVCDCEKFPRSSVLSVG